MKRAFEQEDMVTTFTGQVGMVISIEALAAIRTRFKEGRRPGHYFSPGCCQKPDYVTQIPIFFEDGTFDVMRAMNVKKKSDLPEQKRAEIQKMMEIEK